MLVIPSIDLQRGQCVRLRQGRFDEMSTYNILPEVLAEQYAYQGAKRIHIVDLDGAKLGKPQHLDVFKTLKSCGLPIQAGGGIRNVTDAKAFMNAGVANIVMGSIAITAPALTLQIMKELGPENIILALDVNIEQNIPKPAIQGWQIKTNQSLWDIVAFYQKEGINTILCTDIAMDGMLNGPNFDLYEQAVNRFPMINWQASGGIRDLKDLSKLASISVQAAIIGRALYESEIHLSDWFREIPPC
jgi:phosphoribosylformimino-5-aminoimidazole carboxamide ribotide isomerase